jgi:hypothetical protein
MNARSTVLRKTLPVKPERNSGSPISRPVQLRIAHWQQVSFVPLINHACANVSARNHTQSQSETLVANLQ